MIRNILLDLDDTIFDFHKAEAIAVEKTLQEMGLQPDEKMIQRYSILNQEQWKLLELGKVTRNQVKVRRFQNLYDEYAVNISAEDTVAVYEKYLSTGHYFVDGAEDFLKCLYGKYRLYLVSNGTTVVQKGRIGSSDIEKYFDRIYISEVVGYNKPDIRFFDACFLEIPEFHKSETLIIGDSLSSDIKGGINAGITTVWFNPKGNLNTSDIKPDYEVKSFDEVMELDCFMKEGDADE